MWLRQDGPQNAADLPALLKLQRNVKELEQNKQSSWEQQDKKEGAQQGNTKAKPHAHVMLWELSYYCRNMAALSSRQAQCLPLPLICVCSPQKEPVEPITVGSVELDLEKLKVRPSLTSGFKAVHT